MKDNFNADDLKMVVKEKYGQIASNKSNGCACGCGPEIDYSIFSADYKDQAGYNADADLQLGCGIPTEVANIQKGDHVLDLGSGAGNDCFVASDLVGEEGFVTGLDFTDEMVAKANANKEKTGIKNIEFVKGDIEDMPLDDNKFDVVISNCVLNLVPDKKKAFSQMLRIIKPGGHFCVSDIVLLGDLPDKIRNAAEMYAGCVSGAIQKQEYLDIIKGAGFQSLEVKRQVENIIPVEIQKQFLTDEEIEKFSKEDFGIYSITVYGVKPQ